MQQYLPFTVLKPGILPELSSTGIVATVLTVYGIETNLTNEIKRSVHVATVLTVYGIETRSLRTCLRITQLRCNSTYRLRY